ncbi:uncharacterized protein TRAVEDRAFT_67364, partial [Trametes versicolor FP-101664 SS1]|uniref:uncharacterized protein n=1 Tax=Trametes versicolor (strain FP-101664) TaxID=717944 RepID=UPI00046230DF
MHPLSEYSLPPTALPTSYQSSERVLSVSSPPSECGDAIHDRDKFLGCPRCVICGEQSSAILIVKESQEDFWSELKRRNWIPSNAKQNLAHDPRNGLVLCSNHSIMFDVNRFFIRFIPNSKNNGQRGQPRPGTLPRQGARARPRTSTRAVPGALPPPRDACARVQPCQCCRVGHTGQHPLAGLARRIWRPAVGRRGGTLQPRFSPASIDRHTDDEGPAHEEVAISSRGYASRNRGGDVRDVVVSRVSAGGPELGRHGGGEY